MDNIYNTNQLSLFNRILEETSGVSILRPLKLQENSIDGSINLTLGETVVSFELSIPLCYPLSFEKTSIRFISHNTEGYQHQNLDRSICLHPVPDDDPERKFKSELDLLLKWVKNYYIEKKQDQHYGYLLIENKANSIMLFCDDGNIPPKGTYGEFEYYLLDRRPQNDNNYFEQYIAFSVGGFPISWSNTFQKIDKRSTGIWLFVEDEPVIRDRLVVKSWEELKPFLSIDSQVYLKKHLNFLKDKNVKVGDESNFCFVMIGYKIPKSDGYEAHWELIKITYEEITDKLEGDRTKPNPGKLYDTEIRWGRTINCSYERFFGRGKLCEELTNAKIMIIGIGAIGSSILNHLVRGGCKQITIVDFDEVEAGNICRSNFKLNHVGDFKITAMLKEMYTTSPFVDITRLPHIEKTLPGAPKYIETKAYLNQFDFIFDCSTDMELSYMIDKMELGCRIFNLSITDRANELVCVHGGFNITDIKNNIFSNFNPEDKIPRFYPGTGCQYPTFEASFTDINSLTGISMKRINQMIKNNSFGTFVVQYKEIELSMEFKIYEY